METSGGPKRAFYFILLLLLAGAAGGGAYLAERLYYGPMREQQRLVANLKTVVERLTKDERLAQVMVIDQTPERTKFKFVEINDKGEKFGPPQVFDVEGNRAYFETFVIQFKGKYDPQNDLPLKDDKVSEELLGRSIIYFRGVFGSKQKPEDAFIIDKPKEAPLPYRGSEKPSALELQLWDEFWKLATDPDLAAKHGVHSAHGQAPFTELKKGYYYIIEKRRDGPPTIRVEKVPAVMAE